jgi:membrane protease YdiL (CAAX protease family)
MKKDFLTLILIYIFYSLAASLSTLISFNALSLSVKLAAAVVALAIGGAYLRHRGTIEGEEPFGFIGNPKPFLLTLPIFAPSIGLIMLLSLLTGLILNALGYSQSSLPQEPLYMSIALHGVIPAITEELLFRYLPIKFFLPRTPKYTVIISSLLFALMHFDLFKLPYALIAGGIFVMCDIYAKSVLPSVCLHLLNNVLSILSIYGYMSYYLPLSVALASLISIAVIAYLWKNYKDFLAPLKKSGEEKEITRPFFILCAALTALSVLNLF